MSEAQTSPPAPRNETVQRERYNFPERCLCAVAGLSVNAGWKWTDLNRDRLRAEVSRRTSLTDFGDDRYLAGLDRILAEAQGKYTALGTAMLRHLLTTALTNRLKAVDYIKRHPDVLAVAIHKPIIVLGFPRSGTTLLQNLLAASPERAPLEFWELMSITPVNERDMQEDRDVRVRALERILRTADFFVPELKRMKESSATTPEEDWQLLVPTFHALSFELAYGLGDYGRWLESDADMVWAYSELKRHLQIILHQRPREQLVLKCPDHLWFIEPLLKVFPDACIVQTHRDPARCLTSYTSMISLQERVLTGQINWSALASRLKETFLNGARRAHQARARLDGQQFYDVQFEELVRDPAGTVRAISDYFHVAPPCVQTVRQELNKPRTDKPGSHQYSYHRLEIDPDAVREEFRWYTDFYAQRPSTSTELQNQLAEGA